MEHSKAGICSGVEGSHGGPMKGIGVQGGEEGILHRRGMAWGRVSDPKWQGKEGNHTGGSPA